MQSIEEEIRSVKADVDACSKKRAKDFEFWKEIMIKKVVYEEKNGSISNLLTSSAI